MEPAITYQVVATDTASYAWGTLDGFSYCGDRSYSLTTSPSTTGITIDATTGLLTVQSTDATLADTSV